jgi:hypothetical protein
VATADKANALLRDVFVRAISDSDERVYFVEYQPGFGEVAVTRGTDGTDM